MNMFDKALTKQLLSESIEVGSRSPETGNDKYHF